MNESELRKRISGWIDGSLDPSEVAELEKQLSEDEDARRVFLQFMAVHSELSNLVAGKQQVESILNDSGMPLPNLNPVVDPDTPTQGNSWGTWSFLSLLLVIGLALLPTIIARLNSSQSPSESTAGVPILSEVQPTSAPCSWYVESKMRPQADSFRSGDVVRVTNGKLALTYLHGTKVILHAPAAFQLLSDMEARMIIGRLTANVPEKAKGFSIITPQATVIDLGTEFGVEVSNDGATDFLVFKGEVDVDFHNSASNDSPAQRLRMGEAVRLDAVGTKSRIVSINGLNYANLASEKLRHPTLISKVEDNSERDSLYSYYEIIPGGLQEDALAYVDRVAHEYNGITQSGMPKYLLGADYVKMFNSDKINPGIEIKVTLSGPAKLFVFLDNRLTPPDWLLSNFADTGDDIGVDTGPYKSKAGKHWHNKGPSGIGPGASVENELSIWVKEIPAGGAVKLGPAELSVGRGNSNMYGIAAIPLEEE